MNPLDLPLLTDENMTGAYRALDREALAAIAEVHYADRYTVARLGDGPDAGALRARSSRVVRQLDRASDVRASCVLWCSGLLQDACEVGCVTVSSCPVRVS